MDGGDLCTLKGGAAVFAAGSLRFQSSLITSVAVNDRAPYKSV